MKPIRTASTNRHRPAQGPAVFVRAFAEAAAMAADSFGGVANRLPVLAAHLPIDRNEHLMHPGEGRA